MGLRQTVSDLGNRAFAICRGTLVKADDAHKWQEARVRSEFGDDWSGVEVWHPYGFSSVGKPPADDKSSDAAESIILFPDGSRSHPIVLAFGDRRYRLQGLEEGEVALHDDQGQKVHFKRASIDIVTTKKVNVTADDDVTVTTQAKALVKAATRAAIGLASGLYVTVHDGKVHLAVADPDGVSINPVLTVAGPSSKVFAEV